jgi:multiple sugar transport system ATP-binding protein
LIDIAKSFGRVEAVKDVSLTVESGEFAVFLGPSGCGKTTLLRLVAGLETVDRGSILIDGARIDQLAPGRRGVAMVFQSYALYPHMTARENIAFGLRNLGTPHNVIAEKIAEAARVLEIGHLLDRRPAELSGGQRQRVAIGRAIVKEPKAFLFDEPLSNLDAALRSRTRLELARLHHQLRATMIFVTHDQVEAMTMATRIVVMNAGRIEQNGSPLDIYRRPATRFVATFVGSPAMNVLRVERAPDRDARAHFRLPDGSEVETAFRPQEIDGREIVEIGFRAEHVRRGGDTKARIDVVERLGDRTLVYARLASGDTVACEDSGDCDIAVGDRITLQFPPSAVHAFDKAGAALQPGAPR